jgi:hypothetical protein
MSENEQNIPENTPIPPENTTTTTETVVITERFIDVQKVFSQKSPRLARWIPWFVFNYLRRIIHEKQVNAFLYEHRDDDAKTYSRAVRDYFKLDVVIHGAENLPLTGRCIAASNHPLGGLDGILLMDLIGQLRTDLQVVVNDLLMNIPQLRPYFIPINKHGSNKENLTIFNKAFADENIILYFPAGLVSRKQKKNRFYPRFGMAADFFEKSSADQTRYYTHTCGRQKQQFLL